MQKFTRMLALLLIGYATVTLADVAKPPQFDNIIAFGDSLSDVGNEPDAPITTPGGSTWVCYLGKKLGFRISPSLKGGNDYAYAGALSGPLPYSLSQTPLTLLQQVENYLTATHDHADAQTLYTLQAGANDFSKAGAYFVNNNIKYHQSITKLTEKVAEQSTDNLIKAANLLQRAGAKYIMIGNLPNLDHTPGGHYQVMQLIAKINALRHQANSKETPLAAITSEEENSLNNYAITTNILLRNKILKKNVKVIFIDNFALLNLLQTHYKIFNFIGPLAHYGDRQSTNPNRYIFAADGYHPSGKAHSLDAQYALGVLRGPPYAPQLLSLFQ